MFKRFFTRFKLLIKDQVLPKTFILFLVAAILPAFSIGISSIKHSSEHIAAQMDQSIGALLDDKTHIIDQRIESANNSAVQILTQSDIWAFMTGENSAKNSYIGLSSIKITDMFTILYNATKTNPLIDSVYLYSDKSEYVMTDVMYKRADFYDQELLNLSFEGHRHLTAPREITRDKTTKNVVSYICKIDIFPSWDAMYVNINMNYASLFDNIAIDDMLHPYNLILVDEDFRNVYARHDFCADIDSLHLSKIINRSAHNHIYNIDGVDYYALSNKLTGMNYYLMFIQEYDDIVQPATLLRKILVSTLTVVLLASFLLSCVFSLWVYSPLHALLKNVRGYVDDDGARSVNAYQQIGTAVNALSDQRRELESKYKLVLPYMENYSLQDWLTNRRIDSKNYENVLEALGINFQYGWYVIALCDFENSDVTDDVSARIKSFLNHYNEEFAFVLSRLNVNRVAIIINLDKGADAVYQIFQHMKTDFNVSGIELTISIGRPYDNLDETSRHFDMVSRQLERKFFIGINEIIYASNWFSEGYNLFFDKNIEEDLLSYIRFPDLEKARETLDKLVCDMTRNVNTVDYIKYNSFRILSDILYTLSESGINSADVGFSGVDTFEQINKLSTLESVRAFMDDFVVKCIRLMEALKKTQHNDLVERTLAYLNANFHKNITLDDVSNSVYMSPRYLCGIFKVETGMTIFEYINKMRMEAAKEMLRGDKKVGDIALSLGYNNVQSFFRFFKKYYKMTPVQYRRKHFANSLNVNE